MTTMTMVITMVMTMVIMMTLLATAIAMVITQVQQTISKTMATSKPRYHTKRKLLSHAASNMLNVNAHIDRYLPCCINTYTLLCRLQSMPVRTQFHPERDGPTRFKIMVSTTERTLAPSHDVRSPSDVTLTNTCGMTDMQSGFSK